jgi:uncharacterized protein (TIGR02246 family)
MGPTKEQYVEILDELIAERDIRRLQALYAQHADDGDAESYGALFADDGAIVAQGKRVQGRAAVQEWLLGTLRGKPMRHLMANPDIVVEDDARATGSVDLALLRKEDTGWKVWATIRYRDTYVKTTGGWRFAERVLEPRWR